MTKILFTKAHCLCHDVNAVTKTAGHIDVIMGFSTGEIIWWEPISQRYTRLNKNVSFCNNNKEAREMVMLITFAGGHQQLACIVNSMDPRI